MRTWMKRLLLFVFTVVLIFGAFAAHYFFKFTHHTNNNFIAVGARANNSPESLKKVTPELPAYLKNHNYNSGICFLVDMSLPSGKKRFFVYDVKNDSVINSGLVTHGRCNEAFLNGRRFSNQIGGGCTSLGHYRIGKPYNGRFGLAFKLYGGDSSNSNAFNRFVVLHSHSCVPENEVEPYPICQSDGCPTVAPAFLQQLATIINKSNKPILLFIYK